jgi:hypothetical protein
VETFDIYVSDGERKFYNLGPRCITWKCAIAESGNAKSKNIISDSQEGEKDQRVTGMTDGDTTFAPTNILSNDTVLVFLLHTYSDNKNDQGPVL